MTWPDLLEYIIKTSTTIVIIALVVIAFAAIYDFINKKK